MDKKSAYKIIKRPFKWLLSLILLPIKLLISLVGNILSIFISLILFVILLLIIGMGFGLVPGPDILQSFMF